MKKDRKSADINFEASSFSNICNNINNKFLRDINKEIDNTEKKNFTDVKNLVKIKKRLGKTNKREILEIQDKINKIRKIIRTEIKMPVKKINFFMIINFLLNYFISY